VFVAKNGSFLEKEFLSTEVSGRKVELDEVIEPSLELEMKGICPRGNNKVVIIIFHVYDKCLFLMLELY
jgi:hypothetical protein